MGRTRGGTGPSVKAGVAAATPPVDVVDLLFAFSAAAAEAALVAPTEISCLQAGEREFTVYYEIKKKFSFHFKTNNFNTGRYYFLIKYILAFPVLMAIFIPYTDKTLLDQAKLKRYTLFCLNLKAQAFLLFELWRENNM